MWAETTFALLCAPLLQDWARSGCCGLPEGGQSLFLVPRVTHYPAGEETVTYYEAVAEISWGGFPLQCHLNWASPEADAETDSAAV